MKSGIHLTHKRVGESSFDVVRTFKRAAVEEGPDRLLTLRPDKPDFLFNDRHLYPCYH